MSHQFAVKDTARCFSKQDQRASRPGCAAAQPAGHSQWVWTPACAGVTEQGGRDPRQRRSVGAERFAAGPPQGESAPLGGSDPRQRRSVGATSSVGAS